MVSGFLFDDQVVDGHRGEGVLGDLLRPLWMLQESRHSGQRIQRPVTKNNTKLNKQNKKKKEKRAL